MRSRAYASGVAIQRSGFSREDDLGAMLLERCEPGTALRSLPEAEQDAVIARLLRRIWRVPIGPYPFRPLSEMTAYWSDETLTQAEHWPDTGLVREGLRLFKELSQSAPSHPLLATDLHAETSFVRVASRARHRSQAIRR